MDQKTAQGSEQASEENKIAVDSPTNAPIPKKHPPLIFLAFLFGLIGIFVFGLRFIFSLGAGDVGSVPFLVFDYAVGLSMIFLPCTFPLAFVIVPLVMGKSYGKGIGMALAFGLGVTITLSFYGILIGLLGQVLGVGQVETAKNILYALAGFFAISFALGELKLIRFAAPVYGGAVPQFIMKKKDFAKALLLGLFLGNVGVGCPNPLFNAVIIPQIIVEGSAFQGWLIMFVQALGRITPLFILAFLAILGINATKFLVAHKDTVSKITAWTTIYVGGFLLTLGLFSHGWWVLSGMHTLVEFVLQENFITNLLGSKIAELGHTHGAPTGTGLFGLPIALGTPFILFTWIFPFVWYWLKKKKSILTLPPEQQAFEKRYTRLVGWFIVVLSLWLITVFGSYLPHMFADHWSKGHTDENVSADHEGMEGMEGMQHDGAQDTASIAELNKLPLRTSAQAISTLPYVAKDGVKEFRLEAQEFRWEYVKEKWVHVWGYNGQIPGPQIRVKEGDKVRVIVKNSLPDATTVHWHGVDVPFYADGVPGLTQKAIEPQEEFVYEFIAEPAGTHFYHTHGRSYGTASQQLDMGLSGSLIIEPKVQEYAFDREYTLVLDEWDIKAGGENGAVGHAGGHGAGGMGAIPEYNTFTINGKVYPDTPSIKVKEGEKVLVRFINAGTAEFHPMHLHGHNFEVVAVDGNPLAAPERRSTFTVHPGETADILVTANNPGKWLLHCHHVHHADSGMVMFFEYEGFKVESLK